MSEDYGKHFTGVEDLLQKHMLVEADIQGQADRVKQAIASADAFLDASPSEDGTSFGSIYYDIDVTEALPGLHY